MSIFEKLGFLILYSYVIAGAIYYAYKIRRKLRIRRKKQ